jgi:hypothetical protein
MLYLYTTEQQKHTDACLSSALGSPISQTSFEDIYIETIKSNNAPKLHGEHNGMFNKSHKESSKKLIGDSNRGKVTVKDSDGNTMRVDKNDPRYLSGELIGVATGMIAVKTPTGESLLVPKDDPRYLSGELVGVNKGRKFKQKVPSPLKGTFLAKNREGNMCRLTKDDPRYISGEYIHFRSKF